MTRLRAHAKINLDLRVAARRADGYHDISTVFQSLALHDVVTVQPNAGGLEVTADHADVPPGDGNLCAAAVRAMWQAFGRDGQAGGYSIRIEKQIPVAAGLGGGSSDAAAVIAALAGEWGAGLDDERVVSAARSVGADVPYFLVGGTALGIGRGDVLTPLADRPPVEVVLVHPAFGLQTAEVYRLHDDLSDAAHSWSAGGLAQPVMPCRNDLQQAVISRHPEIRDLVARLHRLDAHLAAMSGSGSTVFGLFPTAAAADRAAAALRDGASVVIRTRTIGREEYRRPLAPA